jgi:hypothetical protein
MQNKPKVKYPKINLSSFVISIYVQVGQLVIQTNKAKQTQFKPNSNPICRKAKIDAKCVFTSDYEYKRGYGPKKTKPKQTQSKPILKRMNVTFSTTGYYQNKPTFAVWRIKSL